MHRFLDHTGEVRIALDAPDLRGLFVEAGRALAELMGGDDDADPGPPVRAVVEGPDREALLAAWIDELIFLSEVHRRVWTRFDVEHLSPRRIEATVRGPATEELRTAVKAATLHGLAITESAGGCAASVVLDV